MNYELVVITVKFCIYIGSISVAYLVYRLLNVYKQRVAGPVA